MDIITLAGLVIGVGAVLISVIIEGGHLSSLVSIPAFLLVTGGTIGATATCYTWEELKSLPNIIRVVFHKHSYDAVAVIHTLTIFAEKARREGLLALEDSVSSSIEDKFLQKGLQLVIDGVDAELVKSIMETEITFIHERHQKSAGIFEAAGGFAPTMGIIGTVIGLVHVLGNLSDTEKLGPAIAVAFIATLYGVALANVFFLPVAAKLKNLSSQQIFFHELTLEGILSLQSGDNPRLLEEKLKAFLSPKLRPNSKKDFA